VAVKQYSPWLQGSNPFPHNFFDDGQEAANGLCAVHELHDCWKVRHQRPSPAFKQSPLHVKAAEATKYSGSSQALPLPLPDQFVHSRARKMPSLIRGAEIDP
jgi:hypothetical protein